MLHLTENLKRYRLLKNMTQEDVADCLRITPQSVSKWERGESYPDITLLPALANIFETSIDLLLGMDTIRAQQTQYRIHETAMAQQKAGDYAAAEKTYRNALAVYPNKPGMILGLAGVLALQDRAEEAIALTEKGLRLSDNEKQKGTARAMLCFLYVRAGQKAKAVALAAQLPHMRESREYILPLVQKDLSGEETHKSIKFLLLGE